jgi:hypothetical protein
MRKCTERDQIRAIASTFHLRGGVGFTDLVHVGTVVVLEDVSGGPRSLIRGTYLTTGKTTTTGMLPVLADLCCQLLSTWGGSNTGPEKTRSRFLGWISLKVVPRPDNCSDANHSARSIEQRREMRHTRPCPADTCPRCLPETLATFFVEFMAPGRPQMAAQRRQRIFGRNFSASEFRPSFAPSNPALHGR